MNKYSAANKTSNEELEKFVSTLTDEQLTTRMPADWTVSGVLAHLAFWDFRAITLIQKWQAEGVGPSAIDTDVINEVSRPFCNAIDPRETIRLMLEYARQLDALVESLSPEFFDRIEENRTTVRLGRGHHRYGHMADIKQALGIN
jgi:hypothetical protein